ncbi:MAG: pyrroline-5-carboxylate reductase [Gemmatimonadetes bacterium]|nr:pyrroline-5-carboxylate reductase [Gemmatimonadota bacterium]
MDVGTVAVLGAGTLGAALARGWVRAGLVRPGALHLTRRHTEDLTPLAVEGFSTGTDNVEAVRRADVVVVAVRPAQAPPLLASLRPTLDPTRHIVVSIAAGLTLDHLRDLVGPTIPVVRAMPNTAIETGDSMTCISVDESSRRALPVAEALFDAVGRTRVIDEELMLAATALCGCGIAFFLRTIRGAAQGGTQIGFSPDDALEMAAQTALGAARLALQEGAHPEREIDRVTTPEGCTIAGLNELEHQGFTSALIRAMLTSSRRAREMSDEAGGAPTGVSPGAVDFYAAKLARDERAV